MSRVVASVAKRSTYYIFSVGNWKTTQPISITLPSNVKTRTSSLSMQFKGHLGPLSRKEEPNPATLKSHPHPIHSIGAPFLGNAHQHDTCRRAQGSINESKHLEHLKVID